MASQSNILVRTGHSHDSMAAMSMVFDSSTKVTLFFSAWSTTSTASYVLTLFCLFIFAIFHRFLGIVKFQLDLRWSSSNFYELQVPKMGPLPGRRHRYTSKDRVSPLPQHIDLNEPDLDREVDNSSTSPFIGKLSNRLSERIRTGRWQKPATFIAQLQSWFLQGIGSWKKSGISALLEALRAVVGYML